MTTTHTQRSVTTMVLGGFLATAYLLAGVVGGKVILTSMLAYAALAGALGLFYFSTRARRRYVRDDSLVARSLKTKILIANNLGLIGVLTGLPAAYLAALLMQNGSQRLCLGLPGVFVFVLGFAALSISDHVYAINAGARPTAKAG